MTINVDAVMNASLYQSLCIDRYVTKEFDETVLPPHDPLLTELRWLWLKHTAGSEPLDSLLGNSEKEVAYHPYLLRFYQAAAHSQPHVEFRSEDKSAEEKSRADIQCFVNGQYRCPSENKATVVVRESLDVSKPGSVAHAIDGQKDAFGKLLRCMISKGLRCEKTVSSMCALVWHTQASHDLFCVRKPPIRLPSLHGLAPSTTRCGNLMGWMSSGCASGLRCRLARFSQGTENSFAMSPLTV